MSASLTGNPFEGIVVADNHNAPLALADFVRMAQALISNHPETAVIHFMSAIEQVLSLGLPAVATALLDLLEASVPATALIGEPLGWMLNARGRTQSGLGRASAAIEAYQRMRVIGEELGNLDMVSTAEMNLGTQAFLGGDLDLARSLQEASLETKRGLGDRYAVVQLELNLALIAIESGRLDDAEVLLKEGKKATRRGDATRLRASLAHQQGMLAIKRAKFGLAKRHFRRALRYAIETDNIQGVVHALQSLGTTSLDLDQIDDAIRWYLSGLQYAEAAELATSQAGIRQGLATAYHRSGDDGKAVEQLESLRTIAERLGDRFGWARAAADLGAMALAANNFEQSIELLTAALEVFREFSDQDWRIRVLRNLIEAQRRAGNSTSVIELVGEALTVLPQDAHAERSDLLRRAAWSCLSGNGGSQQAAIFLHGALTETEFGTPSKTAWTALQAAAALSGSGGKNESLMFYERAINLYGELDDKHLLAQARNDRGNALTNLGRFAEARIEFTMCLDLANQLEDRVIELQAELNLGEMSRREGSVGEAITRFERAIELAVQLQDVEAFGLARGNLGIALGDAGEWDRAQIVFESILADSENEPLTASTAIGGMARIAFVRTDYEKAAELYEQAAAFSLEGEERVHLVEDLAGWLESASILRNEQATQDAAQQIVNFVVSGIGATELAAHALMRAATHWIAGDSDDIAIELAQTAIIVSATGQGDGGDHPPDLLIHVLLHLITWHHDKALDGKRQTELYGRLVARITEHNEHFGNFVRELIAIAFQSDQFRNDSAT